MIKLAIGGAAGRMGKLITSLVEADPDLCLVAKITRPSSGSGSSADARAASSSSESSQTQPGLKGLNCPVDVMIDFTEPGALIDHLKLACERGYKMVIGMTGLQESHRQALQESAKHIPIVYSPNMSIGVNVSYKALSVIAEALQDKADIAITDIHHKNKKDAPSGTALRMKAVIEETLAKKRSKAKVEIVSPPQHQSKIEIVSHRVGDIMGEHQVLFALNKEQLEIRHRAESREIFASGAVLAAKWVIDKPPGLYDMQDVLGLKDLN